MPSFRPSDLIAAITRRRSAVGEMSAAIMGSTVAASLLGYVFWVLVARVSTPGTLGRAAVVITAFTLVGTAASLGVRNVLIVRLPAAVDSAAWARTFSEGLVMTAGGTAVVIALAGAWFLGHSPHDFFGAGVFAAGALMSAFSSVVDGVCIAERASKLLLTTTAVAATTRVALVPLLTIGSVRWEWVAAAWVGSLCVGSALGIVRLRMRRASPLVIRGWWKGAAAALPHYSLQHVVALSAFAPTALLPFIVALRISNEASGYYYASSRLGGAFLMISPAVSAALVAEGARSRTELRSIVRHSTRLIALLLVPTGLALIAFGHPLLSIFGSTYADRGYWLMVVLVAASVPDAVTNLYVAVARVSERLRSAAVLNVTMAVGTLAIAWFTLPSLGLIGAGVAWLVAQGAGALAVPWLARQIPGKDRSRPSLTTSVVEATSEQPR